MKCVLTSGYTGQISAVTFFAKRRKKAAIKNLLGEPGVMERKVSDEGVSEVDCINLATNKAVIVALRSLIKINGIDSKQLEEHFTRELGNLNHDKWPPQVLEYTAMILDTLLDDEPSKVRTGDHLRLVPTKPD